MRKKYNQINSKYNKKISYIIRYKFEFKYVLGTPNYHILLPSEDRLCDLKFT